MIELGEPYCAYCKYSLKGCTESSKCPECGRPLVEVLTRRGLNVHGGRRYRSEIVLMGWPLVDVALGPSGEEARGRARGIIAIGDIATGWIVVGGRVRGIIAVGGFAMGVVSVGGMSLGVFSVGGWTMGLLMALGGGTVGTLSMGGAATGYAATGGLALGYYARGGAALGAHVIGSGAPDPEAARFFTDWAWLLGGGVGSGFIAFGAWIFAVLCVIGLLIGVPVFLAYARYRPAGETPMRW